MNKKPNLLALTTGIYFDTLKIVFTKSIKMFQRSLNGLIFFFSIFTFLQQKNRFTKIL